MKQRTIHWLIFGILILNSHGKSQPETGSGCAAKSNGIDTVSLHQTYLDGDFDILIPTAEAALKTAKGVTASESLFVHKHLAVVYAKYPEKGELAKYHMVRMLNIDPQANLYDMDASDAVYTLFDRVKAENDVRVRRRTGANAKPYASQSGLQSANKVSGPTEPDRVWRAEPNQRIKTSEQGHSKKWLYWVGGILAVGIGVGVTTYLWPDSKPVIEENTVDNRTETQP